MSTDAKFIDGLIFKAPHENAPDFIIAKISIKREDLLGWLQSQDGEWINADLKESREGKLYASVDDWRPNNGNGGRSGSRGGAPQRERPAATSQREEFEDDDIPFITARGRF